MKRVLVFSDTHGQLARVSAAKELVGKVDLLLHLGDYSSDAPTIAREFCVPFYAVRGNCDFWGSDAPQHQIVSVENARILMVHGDAFYSTNQLVDLAEANQCGAALFGHTHQSLLTAQGSLLLLNPGSLSLPRHGQQPSFAVLTVEADEINAKIYTL